jgi:hypothetical protein
MSSSENVTPALHMFPNTVSNFFFFQTSNILTTIRDEDNATWPIEKIFRVNEYPSPTFLFKKSELNILSNYWPSVIIILQRSVRHSFLLILYLFLCNKTGRNFGCTCKERIEKIEPRWYHCGGKAFSKEHLFIFVVFLGNNCVLTKI